MSTYQNPLDGQTDRPLESAHVQTTRRDDSTRGLDGAPPDRSGPPLNVSRVRTETILLESRVAALERELEHSRAEKRALIDRYEALLAESRARESERPSADSGTGPVSRIADVVSGVREWVSPRR